MPEINKPLMRLAVAIHAQLSASSSRARLVDLPTTSWNRCQELVRQIRRAELRGWHLAAAQLMTDLRHAASSIESELTAMRRELPPLTATQHMAKTSEIYRDLVALGAEFDETDFDLRGRWLSVTTEPIELERIYLGPFEIRLDWGRIPAGDRPAYRVIATDPHPAESRDNVPHPHVMDEVLCEGDGRQAIRHALAQGRLLDFFTLIAGVLRNYNPESPFVELALWCGRTCSDCGAVVDDDECFVCERCSESVCEGCEITCCGCDEACCSGCITGCAACDESYCRGCLQSCVHCSASVCDDCLHENERCPKCHEEEQRNQETTDPPAVGAAIQPHGLGQALVPA